jgi:hypothetical protein
MRNDLLADLPTSRLEVIQLRNPLRGELAVSRPAVIFRARAVIEAGVQIHPHPGVRVPPAHESAVRFQAQTDQKIFYGRRRVFGLATEFVPPDACGGDGKYCEGRRGLFILQATGENHVGKARGEVRLAALQGFDGGCQVVGGPGLDHKSESTRVKDIPHHLRSRFGNENDEFLGRFALNDLARGLQAVQPRHVGIEQNDARSQ